MEKLSESILQESYPEWATTEASYIDVAINFASNAKPQQINATLASHDITILEDEYLGGYTIIGRVAADQISALANTPIVLFIDVIQEPAQRLNHENCVQQRVNVLNSSLPGQRNLLGKGVVIGIGDGGELGDHIDFGDRAINIASGTYSSFGGAWRSCSRYHCRRWKLESAA